MSNVTGDAASAAMRDPSFGDVGAPAASAETAPVDSAPAAGQEAPAQAPAAQGTGPAVLARGSGLTGVDVIRQRLQDQLDGREAGGGLRTDRGGAPRGPAAAPSKQYDVKSDPLFNVLTEAEKGAVQSLAPEQAQALMGDDKFQSLVRSTRGKENDTALAIINMAKAHPENTAAIAQRVGDIADTLKAARFNVQPKRVQDEICNVLAGNPSLADARDPLADGTSKSVLGELLSKDAFFNLSLTDRAAMLARIARAPAGDQAQAVERAGTDLSAKDNLAMQRANLMQRLADGKSPSADDLKLLPPSAQAILKDSTTDVSRRKAIVAALKDMSPQEASAVIDKVQLDRTSARDKFYDFLMIDHRFGTSQTPRPDVETADAMNLVQRLNPHAAANFVAGMTRVVDNHVDQKNIWSALLAGVSVTAGVGVEEKGAKAEAGASLSLGPLMAAAEQNADANYRHFLRDTLQSLFGARTDASRRSSFWEEDQVKEFRDQLKAATSG
jgi:hypothetical protein